MNDGKQTRDIEAAIILAESIGKRLKVFRGDLTPHELETRTGVYAHLFVAVEMGVMAPDPPLYPIFLYLCHRDGIGNPVGVDPNGKKWDLSDQAAFKRHGPKVEGAAERASELEKIRQRAIGVARAIKARGTKPQWLVRGSAADVERFVREEVGEILKEFL